MADRVRLEGDARGGLGEAAYYLSAVQIIVSGILAVEGDSLGPCGCETMWWLAMKAEEKLDDALRAIDAEASTIEGAGTHG